MDDTDRTRDAAGEYEEEPEVPEIEDPEVLEAAKRLNEQMRQQTRSRGARGIGGEDISGTRSATRTAGVPPVKVVDITDKTDRRVFNDRPNGGDSITGILLHHTASGKEDVDIYWLSQFHDNPVSTHKVFRRDGTIVKLVPDDRRAWHAGASRWRESTDCNDTMLGYEICNRGDGETYSDAQYESIAQSIAYDCALYHVPDRNVTTHKEVRDEYLKQHPGKAARKTDPLGLDRERIWARVREVRANWPAEWGIPLWSEP